MKTEKLITTFSIILAFIFFSISHALNRNMEKPLIVVTKQDTTWNLKNDMLEKFSLGFKRLGSSILWISTILESDIEHYKKKDLNSWMYLRFNSISILDPRFYENYHFGGTYLSIIKDDIPGASAIFKKGLQYYPEDYHLLKSAGFHFYFEAKNIEEAYPIYKKLQHFTNKNPHLASTFARIQASQGNLTDAFEALTDLQKRYDVNSPLGKKIFSYRYAIRAEIDLDCLNNKKGKCNSSDIEGSPYIKTTNGFIAAKEWKQYRLKEKK